MYLIKVFIMKIWCDLLGLIYIILKSFNLFAIKEFEYDRPSAIVMFLQICIFTLSIFVNSIPCHAFTVVISVIFSIIILVQESSFGNYDDFIEFKYFSILLSFLALYNAIMFKEDISYSYAKVDSVSCKEISVQRSNKDIEKIYQCTFKVKSGNTIYEVTRNFDYVEFALKNSNIILKLDD